MGHGGDRQSVSHVNHACLKSSHWPCWSAGRARALTGGSATTVSAFGVQVTPKNLRHFVNLPLLARSRAIDLYVIGDEPVPPRILSKMDSHYCRRGGSPSLRGPHFFRPKRLPCGLDHWQRTNHSMSSRTASFPAFCSTLFLKSCHSTTAHPEVSAPGCVGFEGGRFSSVGMISMRVR